MAGHTITRAQLTEAVYQEVGLSRNESAELGRNADPSPTIDSEMTSVKIAFPN